MGADQIGCVSQKCLSSRRRTGERLFVTQKTIEQTLRDAGCCFVVIHTLARSLLFQKRGFQTRVVSQYGYNWHLLKFYTTQDSGESKESKLVENYFKS